MNELTDQEGDCESCLDKVNEILKDKAMRRQCMNGSMTWWNQGWFARIENMEKFSDLYPWKLVWASFVFF